MFAPSLIVWQLRRKKKDSRMTGLVRSTLWLGFFGAILAAWWVLYSMAMGMDLDVLGRPGDMAARMAAMDPRMPMYMPMANFGPLFWMWAIMMAAMMLPTLVPTLSAYEDLMASATGTRAGWLGVLLGYFIVWVAFAGLIAAVQLALLFGGVIDMLGIAKSHWFSVALLLVVGAYQFTRAKEVCHGVCHSPMMYFLGNWRAGFAGGVEADNTSDALKIELSANAGEQTDYEECLACQ